MLDTFAIWLDTFAMLDTFAIGLDTLAMLDTFAIGLDTFAMLDTSTWARAQVLGPGPKYLGPGYGSQRFAR